MDGLEDGNVAQIIKVHHAMGDGIANVDLALTLVDDRPDPYPDPDPPAWSPRVPPSDVTLLRDAVADQVRRPAKLFRNATSAVRDPKRFTGMLGDTLQAALLMQNRPKPAPWNVEVTPHRRWVRAVVEMDRVAAIRKGRTATLNDVVLSACAGALREYMIGRGEEVGGERTLAAMVPVSRRQEDERGATLGNKVSLILVQLPIHLDDQEARLGQIHDQTRHLKSSGLADGAEVLVDLAGDLTFIAPELARAVAHQIPMNLVITNVPGPPFPLWVRGASVLAAYPYVEVIDRNGLTIAVLSYQGRLHFGLTADREAVPDLGVLAEGILEQFDRMERELVGSTPAPEAS